MSSDDARSAVIEVDQAFQSGDVAEAAKVLESIPLSAVPPDVRELYSRLRRDVRRAEIQEVTFSAEAEAEPFSGVLGDAIPIALHLQNRSQAPISIPASRSTGFLGMGPREQSIVDVEVEYLEFDRQGSTYETSWHRQIPVRKDLELAPQDSFTLRFSVPTDDERLRPDRVVYRRIVVKPTMWPLSISMGKSVFLAPIAFRHATADVVPRGAAAFRDDPAGTLRRSLAVRGRADVANHIFFAALLLMQKDSRAGAEILRDALLPGDAETQVAVVSALRVATGDFEQSDSDAWRNWCAARVSEGGR
ncbi:MAG: hypothetical protein HYR85_01855 [Planctomycetes bacterium]|nr:hypothetical protein [Planctomycetota bacterium]MBI3848555.1 hypothetical protein [Planctomycetota bacterium]